ncbi:MAG: hypothetical protein OQJ84_03750 [Xanthomonadales bacterium]|nr:hypothetical protein [Xanthomonadales bacterium]
MADKLRLTTLLLLATLSITPVFAQQDSPAPQSGADATQETPPDQEVEVNEDNYRQFMELKDDLRQRTVIPEESFASRSGLQKLDKLPEESQKHLRNELREIISRGDRWQPGDENVDYPYVPSDAARLSAGLQKQEAEAWGELLDNYHAREAQIYANSARSRAAAAASGAMLGQAGESPGDAQGSQGKAAQPGQEQASQSGNAGDNFSPNSQHAEGEQSTEGVAQSAMEFLEKAGYQAGNAAAGDQQRQAGETGQEAAQTQAGSQQPTAQADTQGMNANAAAQNASQAPSQEGTQQNAKEFLQQAKNQQDGGQQDGMAETGSQQAAGSSEPGTVEEDQPDTAVMEAQRVNADVTADENDEPATDGTSQNALEYLAGEGAPTGEDSQDTLTIEDLLNAGGVATGVGAAQEEPEEPPDKPDKDGGG